MECTLEQPLPTSHADLQFIPARIEHIATLRELDTQCFPHGVTFSPARFKELILATNYQISLITHQAQIIGKAHLAYKDHTTRLSDIAIHPDFQRRGYGRKLISYCMNQAYLNGKRQFSLSVETSNLHALTLYQHLGFHISNAIDFWQRPFR
jgi:GNAT superfamily N-acetyltransferase